MAIGREEYAGRRERLGELLEARGIDAMFVPPSSDLEYLTGMQRDVPPFGNISYTHGWVAGAFVAPGREPLFVLPRMVVDFHLGYTPFAVNYFDAYHVVENGVVTDIWPILPRGPLHGGLLQLLEAGHCPMAR
jgi:Xaa-Pro aminopeptidase